MDGTGKTKIMLYGFSSQNEALIGESLRARGNVEVAAWVASRVEGGGFGNINRCRLENFAPNRCPPDVFKKLQEAFAEFFFCRVRPKQMYLQSEKYYDYIDYFAEYANFFYDILDSRKIGAVFFANVPHIGADYVLYRLAKILGVKTFFFYQTLFPDKMICADGVESLGEYASKPRAGSGAPEIKNTFEKNLFYMHRGAGLLSKIKRKFRGLRIRRSAIVLTNILKFPFTAAYRFRMRRMTKSGADMGKKFVYFAMHLQPEATTNPLGGIYADQALAIEHLRQILPDDWS
ncbi:MAG: hypothetical protein IJI37_03510, partial [Opitutales bacterium]|nr:hypothetical protein [Opitutales bacterium]